MTTVVRLNLGCGSDSREGYINVDIRRLTGVDVVADVRSLPMANETASEILAHDILEHVSLFDAPKMLAEWHRVLKPGGTLTLRLPDMRKIAAALLGGTLKPDPIRMQRANPGLGEPTGEDVAIWLLYGDQAVIWGGSQWGSHKWGYTRTTLRRLLEEMGFVVGPKDIKNDDKDYNLHATARKT